MHPDNAAKLSETIRTVDSIYYFTVPCCSSKENRFGKTVPNLKITDIQFQLPAAILSNTNTVTDGGIVLDESWQANDGVVNTISQAGPFNAKMNYIEQSPADISEYEFSTGEYYVFPTYTGSHMSVMGNITKPNPDGLDYLTDLMQMINGI